jgi:Ca-activated chloride channel homolog
MDMSADERDDFDRLRASLRDAAPTPSASRREAAISAAMKDFSQIHQETPSSARHEDQKAGKISQAMQRGVIEMTRKMKMMLAGGTALATSLAAVVVAVNIDTRENEFLHEAGQLSVSEPAAKREQEQTRMAPKPEADVAAVTADHATGAPAPVAEVAPPPPLDVARESFAPSPLVDSTAQPRAERSRTAMDKAAGSMAVTSLVAPMPTAPADIVVMQQPSNDRFDGKEINPVKRVAEEPVSTFSVDVDTASWSFARRMIQNWVAPQPDMVRIEEMVNYFDYDYAAPDRDSEHPFLTHVSTFEAPWNADKSLVRIGIQGEEPLVEDRPPLDLVFLIDTSGSMRSPDKLGLLKTSFAMMVEQLGPEDRVGIVTYAGSAGTVLEMTSASEPGEIISSLAKLEAGGSTAGAAGLRAAYDLLGETSEEGRIGRVILATDGDFNVGMSSQDEMKAFIEDRRDEGAYLSVLGFGQGNYNDALMQTLAQNGNGQAAYIDTLTEARKVLVDQLSGALYPIANDVKIQVEFNPAMVQEYRLIGYETRALAREDFNNDKVDAGEIGAGHQVTALYEITMVGSDGASIPPLRYGETADQPETAFGDELGFVNLRYKEPGESKSKLIGTPIPATEVAPDVDARFAAAIAGFGQLMKDAKYLGDWGYEDAAALAQGAFGEDPFRFRAEAVNLIHVMKGIAAK